MRQTTVGELMELFLGTNDVQKLIQAAAEVLGNPLLICDTSYHFIARSDVRGVRDKSWLEGMKRRSWSYDLVGRINRLELDYTGRGRTTCVLDSINPDSSRRRKLGLLCVDGAHVGYYFVLEEWTDFGAVPEETYRQVGAVLAKSMCTDRSRQVPGGGGERLLLDLLQSGFEDRRLFLERAAEHELARPGAYRVFRVEPAGEGDGGVPDPDRVRSRIGQCLPLSWQVSLGGGLAVLADLSRRSIRQEESMEQFGRFLSGHGLRAGQSDAFTDPFYLKRYYGQACSAARLGRLFGDGRPVIPYEDYKLYALFRAARGEEPFTSYSSEVIRRVWEHDAANGTQYLDTVRQYLACGCSVQKAARRLYVHRNTVAYRIGRARELFGLRFDDDEANHLNYVSCLLRAYCDRVPEEK